MRFQNVQEHLFLVNMVWLYLVLQMMLTYQVLAQSGNGTDKPISMKFDEFDENYEDYDIDYDNDVIDDSIAKGNVHYVQNISLAV